MALDLSALKMKSNNVPRVFWNKFVNRIQALLQAELDNFDGGGAEIYKTALLRITGGGSGITELYNDTGDTFSISPSGDVFFIESTTPFTGDEKISYNNIFLSGPTPGDMLFVGCSLVTYISGKRIQLSPAIFFGSPAEGPSLVPAIPDSTIEIKILA
jgi:hypothetical protein